VLDVLEKDGSPALGRTRDILPDKLPDLFEGDRLVLLGQYVGDRPVTFRIRGNYLGETRTFTFTFHFDKANVQNGFVPRLWASRKIAELIDAIRQMGADPATSANDPKVKELVDEIVRLSTEFGILTEYTAFLAREGTDLGNRREVLREAADLFESRALEVRSGAAEVNQSLNMIQQKEQQTLNYSNVFLDANMQRVSVAGIQQVNDWTYYRRGNRWVDSRLIGEHAEVKPKRIVRFGSDEYIELARRLARENRQGSIALSGDVLLLVDGEPVLIQGPTDN
jgi:Ca-activated chloride channel family protein